MLIFRTHSVFQTEFRDCLLLRERLEGSSDHDISSVKTHKRKFKATVSIPDVVEPVELSSQQMDQDFEAEAANIEPVPAPAAAGSARTSPAKAVKVSAKETDGNTSPSPGKASGKPKTAPAPAPPGKGRRGGARGAR